MSENPTRRPLSLAEARNSRRTQREAMTVEIKDAYVAAQLTDDQQTADEALDPERGPVEQTPRGYW